MSQRAAQAGAGQLQEIGTLQAAGSRGGTWSRMRAVPASMAAANAVGELGGSTPSSTCRSSRTRVSVPLCQMCGVEGYWIDWPRQCWDAIPGMSSTVDMLHV